MLSTNLEISHPSNADAWTSAACDDLLWLWFWIHTLTNMHVHTHTHTFRHETCQWRISVSPAISVLDHIQLFNKLTWGSGSPSSVHALSNSWRGLQLQHLYNTMDDCMFAITAKQSDITPVHVMQWCCSDAAHVHVMLRLKSLKTSQEFLHTVDEGLVLGLPPPPPHPLPYSQRTTECLWTGGIFRLFVVVTAVLGWQMRSSYGQVWTSILDFSLLDPVNNYRPFSPLHGH